MKFEETALAQGMDDTRLALRRWQDRPGRILAPWSAASLAVAVALLLAVWAISTLSTPDPIAYDFPGIDYTADLEDYGYLLIANGLVLALHALACVAGFIAGSSLPMQADQHTGTWRWIHEKAGPLAIAFVVAATSFSLCTQAYALGGAASTVAAQLGTSPGVLVLCLLPHALPELVALFLPLAAWIIASRREQWDQLLAATFVTVAIAFPVLVVSSVIEVYVTPHILRAIAG